MSSISSTIFKTLLALLFLQAGVDAQSNRKSLIKVLVIDGYSNHDWKQTSKLVKGILEESKLFEVAIFTAPATINTDSLALWNPGFSDYDAVIQNTNNVDRKNQY